MLSGRAEMDKGKLVKRQGRKTMGLRVKYFADDRQVAFLARIQPAFFIIWVDPGQAEGYD